MVILNKSSTIDKDRYPLCHNWDVLCRQNHSIYQNQIDKYSYAIQRSRRSLFGFVYPNFFQLPISRLEVIRRKQYLGQIYQQQLDRYKTIDPWIEWNYKRCFSGSMLTSVVSVSIGAFLCAFATKSPNLIVRIMFFGFPIIAEQFLVRPNANTFVKLKQFLDFTIAIRRAKCLLELFGQDFDTDLNRLYLKNANVYKLMDSMIKLNEVKSN